MELRTKHIVLPYILGILWMACHPIISIVTGELKCRGIFTDEHQLDPRSYNTESYPSRRNNSFGKRRVALEAFHSNQRRASNVCHVLETLHETTKNSYQHHDGHGETGHSQFNGNPFSSPYISCVDTEYIAAVKIMPSQAPADPTEAIVVVLPYAEHWLESDLHTTAITMVERLHRAPWLTKAIFVVSPVTPAISLEVAVDQFVGAYTRTTSGMGNVPLSSSSKSYQYLPTPFKNYLLRQLIVLDAEESDEYAQRQMIQILPQGRRGIVPNLDLISAARYSFQKTTRQNSSIPIQMHPFDMTWWNNFMRTKLPAGRWWRIYGEDLGGMLAFMAASLLDVVLGSSTGTGNNNGSVLATALSDLNVTVAPHAPALREGIDAITIRAKVKPNGDRRVANRDIVALVQGVEHLLRGLSNLNERLHHNVNQYIMPSSNTFVSHGEYILPAILLLLPLALRVIAINFQLLQVYRFEKACRCMCGALAVSMAAFYIHLRSESSEFGADQGHHHSSLAIIVIYVIALRYACDRNGVGILKKLSQRQGRQLTQQQEDQDLPMYNRNDRWSIQCVACLMALYAHVPIILSNISLAVPSAILWIPFLSFPDYGIPGSITLFVANTFLLIVFFFGQNLFTHSIYTCAVLAPMHFLLACLCWS